MLVHFITDNPSKIPAIQAMLEPRYGVIPWRLDQAKTEVEWSGALVVEVDLRNSAIVKQVRSPLSNLGRIRERVFVVKTHVHHAFAQPMRLGQRP